MMEILFWLFIAVMALIGARLVYEWIFLPLLLLVVTGVNWICEFFWPTEKDEYGNFHG